MKLNRFLTLALLVLPLCLVGAARDIHQAQKDIQHPNTLLVTTPFTTNINVDDTCIFFRLNTTGNNPGGCSIEFGSWYVDKDVTVTRVTVTLVGVAADNGECRLSLWEGKVSDDTFNVQIATNMDYDATSARGTIFTFEHDFKLKEGVFVGFFNEDDDQAGTCTTTTGNDADILVSVYGTVTN